MKVVLKGSIRQESAKHDEGVYNSEDLSYHTLRETYHEYEMFHDSFLSHLDDIKGFEINDNEFIMDQIRERIFKDEILALIDQCKNTTQMGSECQEAKLHQHKHRISWSSKSYHIKCKEMDD